MRIRRTIRVQGTVRTTVRRRVSIQARPVTRTIRFSGWEVDELCRAGWGWCDELFAATPLAERHGRFPGTEEQAMRVAARFDVRPERSAVAAHQIHEAASQRWETLCEAEGS